MSDRLAVQPRPEASLRSEQLVADRIVDDAQRRPATDHEPDTHTEHGYAVRVVHRAVEWVDDPDALAGRIDVRLALGWHSLDLPGLFRQKPIVRECLADGRDDELLRHLVYFRDDVVFRLVNDALEALVSLHLEPAGSPRGVRGNGHLGVVARCGSLGHTADGSPQAVV